jgi:hypothetical protein
VLAHVCAAEQEVQPLQAAVLQLPEDGVGVVVGVEVEGEGGGGEGRGGGGGEGEGGGGDEGGDGGWVHDSGIFKAPVNPPWQVHLEVYEEKEADID